jgi:hypothetical protein
MGIHLGLHVEPVARSADNEGRRQTGKSHGIERRSVRVELQRRVLEIGSIAALKVADIDTRRNSFLVCDVRHAGIEKRRKEHLSRKGDVSAITRNSRDAGGEVAAGIVAGNPYSEWIRPLCAGVADRPGQRTIAVFRSGRKRKLRGQ